MKTPDSKSARAWLCLFPLLSLAWVSCSDNPAVSAGDGSVCVSDSLVCVGGLHTLGLRQWWEEIQYDTLRSIRDSANVRTTVEIFQEHRKYSEVMSAVEQNGEWQYRIRTRDSILRPGNPRGDSVSIENILLQHSDSLVRYNIPIADPFFRQLIDTLKFDALKLPPTAGIQWSVLNRSVDTSTRFFTIMASFEVDLQADAAYGSIATCNLGAQTYGCRVINRSTDFNIAVISEDSLGSILMPGDTIVTSLSHSVQEDRFNFDLSASLWSREEETKKDSNYVDSSVTLETNIKHKILSRYARILSD